MTLDLRILATTDLHMHIMGHDYFADRASERFGLSRAATRIAIERGAATNSLLFDNGDSLQGGPMGDFLAETGWPSKGAHPAISAMNLLGYDAATVGNHDFSFGLRFLRDALAGADFPIVASNLVTPRGLAVQRRLILQREMRDRGGNLRTLRIGVLGFLPPQTIDWEPELRGAAGIGCILDHARQEIAALQAERVDLVVALAHSGIGELHGLPMMENAATALAALAGIDVVIAGHTHRVFPSAGHPSGPAIDPLRGTLAGKPCVMPGFWGSHLGVIELTLKKARGTGWRVADFRCRAEPVERLPAHEPVARRALPAHLATMRHFRRRIGRSERPLTSFFTLIGDDPGLRLVAMAQRWQMRELLAGTRWRDLPILSAAAPFRAGGRGGAEHFTNVPAGRLTLRSLADLYLFPNRICALLVNGADLADWLERSASIFHRIVPGVQNQPLVDQNFPGYNFDLIDGLNWQLDLAAPPRHAPDGRLLDQNTRRVLGISFRGRPVAPDESFVLVTNSYRLSDSGVFSPVAAHRPVLVEAGDRTRDVLRRYISRRRVVAPDGALGWTFRPMPGTSVRFATGPGAVQHLPLSGRRIDVLGLAEDGFLDLRLHI